MFCPECRAEYREGFVRCGSCNVDLVPELPPEDTFASVDAMAKALATKELQAIMVGSHVDLGEVQRFLSSKRLASVMAGEPDLERPIEAPVHNRLFLMVAAGELERARDLIHHRWREGAIAEGLMLSEAPVNVGQCPACGAEVPLDAKVCPECELYLGEG